MTTRRTLPSTASTRALAVGAVATAIIGAAGATGLSLLQAASASAVSATAYDAAVLADAPVAYWAAPDGTADATGHGHVGTAVNGAGSLVPLPNGQGARTYDGVSQYVTVPSSSAFSIPTRKALTWEAWIRPSTLTYAKTTGGYVDFLGKCASYSPTCEWEGRMYSASSSRPSRISGYVFNPTAGLGSAADWQPAAGTLSAGRWIHVVAEYQTTTTPSRCSTAYPGSIQIWVDGVRWNDTKHGTTGCMSQYAVKPQASSSPLRFGTMARDSFFAGAIGKVAIYPRLLSQTRITAHYTAMTGLVPSGSCGDTCTLASQPGAGAWPAATATPTATTTPTAITTATATATPTTATTATTTTAMSAPTATSTPTAGVTASWRVTSSWSTGYCAAVTVTSTIPVTSWKATLLIRGRARSVWGATYSQSGSQLTLASLSYDGRVSPTAPVTGVGFCASS